MRGISLVITLRSRILKNSDWNLTAREIMKSYRELRVWQHSMDLVESIYLITRKFPKQETYGLTQQIQRAIVSVPSNIAEGHTREHLKEYLHHLSIA
jgi:hypothetical protein